MPTPTTYLRDRATDFPSGVNLDNLEDEVFKSSVSIKLERLGLTETEVELVFADDLEAQDPDQLPDLEALFPNHDPVAKQSATKVEVTNVGPRTADDVPIQQVNHIPKGHYFWGSGAFDDFEPNPPATGRGQGLQIAWKTNGEAGNTSTREGRFFEHVYILGGVIQSKDAEYDDYVSLDLVAPASTPDDRTGTNDGNANKAPIPGAGFNIIVPAPGGDGSWNVDGTTKEFGQVNAGLTPIPARDGDDNPIGWWDWDPDKAESITPNLNQTGGYNLLDAEIPLARQANRYPILAPYQNVTPEAAVKGKKVLPHWLYRFTLVRGVTAGEVKVAIRVDTARKKTT